MRIFIYIAAITALAACASSAYRTDETYGGRKIPESPIARCMNLGNALDAPRVEGAWGYIIRYEDMVRLKEAGFDTVRIPARWSTRTAETPPYTIDPRYLYRVDEVIGWAEELGLNAIINVHHYYELNGDPDNHEARLEAIWDQLAAHYADASDHLIFETINEPHNKMTVARTDALNRRLLTRIRQDNPDRWVILGTARWGSLEGLEESDPPYDPRAILTYHDYQPFAFTHQGAFWNRPVLPMGERWGTKEDRAEMRQQLDRALKVQRTRGMPVFVGEFGVFEKVPQRERAAWIKAMRKGLEARGMGWCHWDYATTLKAYDLRREEWLPQIRKALVYR